MPLFFRFLLLTGFGMLLEGCNSDQGIKNDVLRERVIACGAGFSDETVADLHASYLAHAFNGQLGGQFKDQARAMIFSEIAPQDRLKAYEDYIKCIESKSFPGENTDYPSAYMKP